MTKTRAVPKMKTRFEQVSLDVVRKIAGEGMGRALQHLPTCAICGDHVELEHCKTDERGDAVHDACYVARVASAKGTSLIKAQISQSQSARP